MSKLGIIVKLDKRVVCVMTKEYEFHYIKRKPGMFLGQQVEMADSQVVGRTQKVVKYSSWVAGIAAVFLAVALFFSFKVNDGIYAFVDLDFNRSIEFLINDENKVIKVNTSDESTQSLIDELELEDKPLNDALRNIISRSKEIGLIDTKDNNLVLISAALNCETREYKQYQGKEEKKLEDLLKNLSEDTDKLYDKYISTEILKVDPEIRKKAMDNDISMGRYSIYKEAMDLGVKTTMDEIKNGTIADIIEKVYHNKEMGDKKGNRTVNKDDLNGFPNSKNDGKETKDTYINPTPAKQVKTTPDSKGNVVITPVTQFTPTFYIIYTPKPESNNSENRGQSIKPRVTTDWNHPTNYPTRQIPQYTPSVDPLRTPNSNTPSPQPTGALTIPPVPTHGEVPTDAWIPTHSNFTMPPTPTHPERMMSPRPTPWTNHTGDWPEPSMTTYPNGTMHTTPTPWDKPTGGWTMPPKPTYPNWINRGNRQSPM